MKNYKINISFSLLIFCVIFILSSCRKEIEVLPETSYGTLMFHLHTNADTNEVETYGDTMIMTGGRQIVVTTAQLYISEVKLAKIDGSLIDGPSQPVLKMQETEPYVLGNAPAGNYQSVKFNIGLNSSTNSSTPASSDLVLNRPDMWFDSTAVQPSGFVFVKFQGMIDTATVPSASNALIPFSYRIGTNSHLTGLLMPSQNFMILPNQESEVHIIIDYARLFDGVTLNMSSNLQVNTTSDNLSALATQIANNITLMFSYEE